MITVQDIFDTLCRLAPLDLQLDFDNSGFLVGHPDQEVSRVLLTLDITEPVVDEAIAKGVQLIISHHPLIWDPLKSITSSGEGAKALRLIEHQIAAICMHTNLDIANGGVNDVLMQKLGGEVEGPLDKDGCGRIGHLAGQISLEEFLLDCKRILKANGLRFIDSGRPVYKLAVMGGAGSHAIEDAFFAGCDTYVTSDIKYHQFQQAQDLGLNLIDADHFCTENPVIPVLADRLRADYPEISFIVSEVHNQLIQFI